MQNTNSWHYAKKIFGLILIALGIIQLILPRFKGIAMIITGLIFILDKKFLVKIKKIYNSLPSKFK